MATKLIIGFSGKKGSGKDTAAACVRACWAKYMKLVPETCDCSDPKIIESTTPYFYKRAFADSLKEMVINVFNIPPINVYGSDEDKNRLTKYRYDKLPDWLKRSFVKPPGTEYLTVRDLLQIIGTDIFRTCFGPDIWVDSTMNKIQNVGAEFSIITDVRFPSEVNAILAEDGGYVIRLTRNPYDDPHSSEHALDEFKWSEYNKAFVLDNSKMTIADQKIAVSVLLTNNIFNQISWNINPKIT